VLGKLRTQGTKTLNKYHHNLPLVNEPTMYKTKQKNNMHNLPKDRQLHIKRITPEQSINTKAPSPLGLNKMYTKNPVNPHKVALKSPPVTNLLVL
jgi:hypothetical protein